MEKYKLYKCGGCVRDALLGIKSKDIDYSFVFEDIDYSKTPQEYYEMMKSILIQRGIKIHTEKPDCYTIRGFDGKEDVDFVMARKESYPNPNSRIPRVEMGTLYDDLERRDFTLNALAEDDCGNLIDHFNGVEHLKQGILKCPVDAKTSFNDDPLRMLRALRFTITKGFRMDSDIDEVISTDTEMWDKFARVVKGERVRDELTKMFKYNTIHSMMLLTELDSFSDINILERLFRDDTWLEVTNKKNKNYAL